MLKREPRSQLFEATARREGMKASSEMVDYVTAQCMHQEALMQQTKELKEACVVMMQALRESEAQATALLDEQEHLIAMIRRQTSRFGSRPGLENQLVNLLRNVGRPQ
mmetsp:Transcript_25768/g.58335  ORF Transcript_25768/g.58335 Transcript_25768/m.58335 type:complete len:108 (+) Transcript_25768:2-325(+)